MAKIGYNEFYTITTLDLNDPDIVKPTKAPETPSKPTLSGQISKRLESLSDWLSQDLLPNLRPSLPPKARQIVEEGKEIF